MAEKKYLKIVKFIDNGEGFYSHVEEETIEVNNEKDAENKWKVQESKVQAARTIAYYDDEDDPKAKSLINLASVAISKEK